MKEFFATYPLLAWSIVSTLCAAVVIVALWEKVKWWWFNTWVSFPLVGRIASLSRDVNKDPAFPGWYSAERTLCQEYKRFVHIQDEHDFNEKITYLTKAGDSGRSAMPGWIWVLTVALVFVEALGFSYVLAGYTIPMASENTQQAGALGIAFLLSVILVGFTHFAGHELYRSNLIKNARRAWIDDNRAHKLLSGEVPLARPQSADDAMPAYTQLCNRVGSQASYVLGISTVVMVLFVAGLATYVRGQVLEKELNDRVTLATKQIESGQQSANDSMDMAATALPAADVGSDNQAEKKAVADAADIDRHGGWATFIVLAVVFLFLQVLGVIFGYRWGFAGKNSAQAYRDIGSGRYSSYTAVREHYRQIADIAQAKLAVLQQRIMSRNATSGTSGHHLSKTFRDFVQEHREQDAIERSHERAHAMHRAQQHAAPIAVPRADATLSTSALLPMQPADIGGILAQLDALGDNKSAKLELLGGLERGVHAQVVAALKKRKEAQELQARNAEIEGLL